MTISKIFLVTIIFFNNSLLNSQIIPDFESNTNNSDSLNSPVFNAFRGKHDFILAFSSNTARGTSKIRYTIIGLSNNIWTSYLWDVQFKDGERNFSGISKTRLRKVKNSKDELNNLIAQFNSHKFWILENDSLNINSKQINDSTNSIIGITDGINYEFEYFTFNKYRKTYSYSPELHQDFIYSAQRKVFIDCREIFIENMNK